MVCLFCFSKERLSNDELKGKYGAAYAPFSNNTVSKYKVTMCQAPCAEPVCWCTSMACFCPVQIYLRHRVLNHVTPDSGWSNYRCCQGYFGGCLCLQPGQMGEESCPVLCMCMEACLCPGPAVSASSGVVRERYGLGLDEDDVRLIRCSNFLFYLSVCLNCISALTPCEGDDIVANVVDTVADVVFCCVGGCLTAQVHHEMKMRENSSPLREMMRR
mmetsp:Transcript_20812/g.26271  ORF Transcript_20812/g.26271 Transcript_20812/m.26271 type:complete len:216 (+) Transcript_20812:95-742(+)